MVFDDDQTARLNALSRRIEQRTGARLITAVVDRSDSYPEIPWKSFALGVCAHALLHLMQTVLQPEGVITWSVQQTLGFIIGTSAGIALLTQFWTPFGRLFLARSQAEKKAGQFAAGYFLERELFHSPARTCILLLVSLFERQVVLLTDSGIAAHLDAGARRQVIDRMTPHLRREDPFQAIVQGLAGLEAVLPSAQVDPALNTPVPEIDTFIRLKGLEA
ncbi:MAG: hypothetical protein C4519_01780 [Desulfobacteraceae bacterium]|nr:MAG: hypothetical protein C4519_01780 [Desulfobacteraceae bacterium]